MPNIASVNRHTRPEANAEEERVFSYAPYTDHESIEARQEAIRLISDPNAKTYNNVRELFADCLGEESDED